MWGHQYRPYRNKNHGQRTPSKSESQQIVDEIPELIGTHRLPKLTPGEIENLNGPTTSKENKSVIKNKIRGIQTANNEVKLSVQYRGHFFVPKKKILKNPQIINR